jgi:cation-transporting ATPase 13A3/4/5
LRIDGENDCGALKVDDVGISLSQKEVSIAESFSSKIPDISCIIEVLKEGKCTIKKLISVTFLILLDSYLSNWEYIVIVLFLITPLAFLMPLTPNYDKIDYHRLLSSLFFF